VAIKPFTFVPRNLIEWSRFLDSAQVTPDTAAVTHEMIENSAAVSVLGRATGSAGVIADIAASANGQYLGRRSDAVGFFALQDADIPSSIARDSEVTSAISGHAGEADPHTVYALETTSTFTGTLTGCTTSPTGTLRYTKVGSVVLLYIPQINATSNTTAATITGAPAAIFPARAQRVRLIVQDNTTVQGGMLQVETNGTLTMYASVALAVFTAAGTKGVELQTVAYSLD